MKEPDSKLVYSTEWAVPREKKHVDRKAAQPAATSGKNRTIVRLDRKGRGGKTVTVIEGLQLSAEDSEKLLKQLKAKLGTGGAVKNGVLEIQGDHCDAVMAELTRNGYKPKRSGG
jgi:translation initiation factor 1